MGFKTYVVEFTKFAAKQTLKLPTSIQEAVFLWKKSVEQIGLPEVRKSKGYRDELLKGQRKGQRSIRLNRTYRLIYVEFDQGEVVVVGVQEVNKHEY
jgi:toxin HigB-1